MVNFEKSLMQKIENFSNSKDISNIEVLIKLYLFLDNLKIQETSASSKFTSLAEEQSKILIKIFLESSQKRKASILVKEINSALALKDIKKTPLFGLIRQLSSCIDEEEEQKKLESLLNYFDNKFDEIYDSGFVIEMRATCSSLVPYKIVKQLDKMEISEEKKAKKVEFLEREIGKLEKNKLMMMLRP